MSAPSWLDSVGTSETVRARAASRAVAAAQTAVSRIPGRWYTFGCVLDGLAGAVGVELSVGNAGGVFYLRVLGHDGGAAEGAIGGAYVAPRD
jgi:hypothetical protein